MYDSVSTGRRTKRWAGAAGLLAAGAISGGVLASALSASARATLGAYEVHMKKADGSLVTVKFGKNLKVTKVESGMGAGDPAPAGHGAPGAAA